MHMLLKQKSPSLPRNLPHGTFTELLIVFSTKANLLYLLYSTDQRCFLLHHYSASDKAKLFAKNFSKNSNLDYSGISLTVFPSITNLKLHNIFITLKVFKKVIVNLESSKASGPDCIPVVVLKNCEPELSYIPAELFNMCLKESCRPLSLFSVVSKVFEKFVNNRIVDHLEKSGLFQISSMVLDLDQLQIF